MNKTILGLAAVATIGAGAWFITSSVDSYDYVETVDTEITQLETELAALDTAIADGTLSVEQATEAKIAIVKRLDTITAAANNNCTSCITPAQRAQLLEGLDRLKNVLLTYQATLTSVDNTADQKAVTKKLRRSGSYTTSRPLATIITDTISDVEDVIVEIITEEPVLDTDDQVTEVAETESETTEQETTDTEAADVTDTESEIDEISTEEESGPIEETPDTTDPEHTDIVEEEVVS